MSLLDKVFGDPHKREIGRHNRLVMEINDLEDEIKALSDDELRHKTVEFRERLGYEGPDISYGQTYVDAVLGGGDAADSEDREVARLEEEEQKAERARHLDELLPEAFAVVREAARRLLGMRPFDVQLVGGIVLHQGKIAEMRTGEGKTLVATLPLYLNALSGHGGHLVTVNDYLARRDAGWNAPVYHFLGMSVGVIAGQNLSYVYDPEYLDEAHTDTRLQHLRPCSRRESYACDITYATNNELGFDYLRDNMAQTVEQCVQRRLHYAIVDEVDSILVDEARTPLIISGQGNEPTEKYYTYARIIPRLVAEDDYTMDEKTKSVTLTDDGVAKMEKWTGIPNIYDLEHAIEAHQINQALRAWVHYQRDRDYIVREDEVIIVDEFTGRTMPGRRWSDGLHQAIEAKEGVRVQQENITLATITFQNFFRLYQKLAGMTGTALTEAEEFDKIYKLEVVPIPTNMPMVRKDEPDLIYRTETAKYQAVVDDIAERHKTGQPVLVGTTSIERSERISRMLEKRGVIHSVLNAKQHEREASIVADAGKAEAVTIATNMAGRGTDIVLGAGVADLGGLYIVGTERHESRRIDRQLRGRCSRQGDPGLTKFFLSFEDELLRIFLSGGIASRMMEGTMKDGEELEHRWLNRSIESAQKKVEQQNFSQRKRALQYDDVLNLQREVIYGIRNGAIAAERAKDIIFEQIEEELATRLEAAGYGGRGASPAAIEAFVAWVNAHFPIGLKAEELTGNDLDSLAKQLIGRIKQAYAVKEAAEPPEALGMLERYIVISAIDHHWQEHLTELEDLRKHIGLRGYGQKDPLVEYKNEAYSCFAELMDNVRLQICTNLFRRRPGWGSPPPAPDGALLPPPPTAPGPTITSRVTFSGGAAESPSSSEGEKEIKLPSVTIRRDVPKVGRNDPCPCGSGKKYKQCHGA